MRRSKEPPGVVAAASALFGFIFSLAARRLLRPDPITPFRDSKPTVLTTRGAAFDYVVGRHRPNVIFGWAGKRTTSGGNTFEEGVHWLHAGRIRAIHKIVEDGKVLYDFGPGGITSALPGVPENPPQTFTTTNGQAFTVFWGHPDPAAYSDYASLADPERLGVASRWPGTAFVWWHPKKLNPGEQWPLIEYEISVEPQVEHLTRTDKWIGSYRDLDPATPAQQMIGFSKVGNRWKVSVAGNLVAAFGRAKYLQLDFINEPAASEESGPYEIDASQHVAPLGTQHAVPTSSISNNLGLWTAVNGTLVTAIDEGIASPSDSDYIVASSTSAACELGLASMTDPNSGGGHSFGIRYRIHNTSGVTQSATLRVEMLNDATGTPSVFYTRDFLLQNDGVATPQWVTQNITIPPVSVLIGLFDYSDIGVRFTIPQRTSGAEVRISAFEMLVVDQGKTEVFLREIYDFDLLYIHVGTAQPYLEGADGVNPAHFVAELLFDPAPRGRGISKALFDLETFEVSGEKLLAEHVPINARWQDAPQASAVLASVMQDIGLLIRLDPTTGLYGLHLVREDAPILDVPSELLLGPVPERIKNLGPKKVSRTSYIFDDRARSFRKSTYLINDDGEASRVGGDRRDQPVEIRTMTDFSIAKTAAERRALENEIGEGSALRLRFQGGLRDLCPGQRIRLPGETEVLVVDSVRPVPLSPEVTVEALPDLYGAPEVNEQAQQATVLAATAALRAPAAVPVENAAEALLELPDALQPAEGGQAVALLQIRGSGQIVASELQASLDGGVTFVTASRIASFAAGGELLEDLDQGGPYADVGPTLTVAGPDALELIQDLRGDEDGWRSGRQLLVLGSEVCFLEGVDWLDETTVRLGRIIRARHGTRQEDHATGATAFILPASALTPVEIAGLQPYAALSWRAVPMTRQAQLAVESITVHSVAVTGRGVVPPAPENVLTEDGVPAYKTGEDVRLRWTFVRGEGRRIGAGRLSAGTRTGKVRPRGAFAVSVSDVGAGLSHHLDGVLDAQMTLTNARILELFGAEPALLRFGVVHIVDGWASEETTLDVVKL